MHGRLIMASDHMHQLTTGSHTSPQFSISFPARKIAPFKQPDPLPEYHIEPPCLEDLVIPAELREQINELISWLKHKDELTLRMRGKIKKGYRTLFYGPPGTGKTFTAEILGNELQRDVYKIDLSMVVSKYIGETEKNLELLFSRAEDTGWILFFDEADALFGKRTNVRDAHDKYANQEVSYLLQRIEDYDGLVILASNMKNNIDDAFIRRFNSILHFPFPDAEQRALIWQKSFPPGTLFMETLKEVKDSAGPVSFNLPEAVKKYELAGGSIMNVIHYAGVKAIERAGAAAGCPDNTNGDNASSLKLSGPCDTQPGGLVIYLPDVKNGIKRELIKEGKPFIL
jgi:hypothetical protein